jgi:hypothetical protein
MRILFASTFLLGVALCTPAQDSQTQIRAAVQPILTRQQDAWNQRDLEAFMSGYWNSPDLTFFSGANAITGWEPTLEQYRKRYQSEGRQMGQFQFSDVQITPIVARCRIRARRMEADHERWQGSARPVYVNLPKIFQRLEKSCTTYTSAE